MSLEVRDSRKLRHQQGRGALLRGILQEACCIDPVRIWWKLMIDETWMHARHIGEEDAFFPPWYSDWGPNAKAWKCRPSLKTT